MTLEYPSGQSVAEALEHQSQLESSLKTGLNLVSADQEIVFTPYVRLILPLDGWLFWVNATMLNTSGPSAILDNSPLNTYYLNQGPAIARTMPEPLSAPGSLHITTSNRQLADESLSVNAVTFTSKVPVDELNLIQPGMMYIAKIGDFKVSFSGRRGYYRQANLYHYTGDAVYPVLETQVVDNVAALDTKNVIVSNSLPIWLTLNRYMPMYPSFLIPDDIRPPYCAVDIPEESTYALQSFPFRDQTDSHWQLVHDRVKLSIFGLRNFNALDFQDYIIQQSLETELFGFMNCPVIRDAKRIQVELGTLAQKKSMEIEISYYQTRVRNIARQLILQAIPSFVVAN